MVLTALADHAPARLDELERPVACTPPQRTEGRPRLPHEPALDGLRGLAVVGVLLFHSGFSWAVGGYLGVSTFFTLSGFLITGLLLHEWRATGGIRLGQFWVRRFRRLGPALLLTLVGIAGFAWFVADPDQLASLRADAVAALGYVANWRFVLDGQAYADLFEAPTPLLHTWSLAIEEQFYVLYPLLVAAVLWLGRGSRKVLAVTLGGLAVASVVAGVVLHTPGADPSRIYYGTDTRAAELLLGALLAVWLATRGKARTRTVSRWVAGVGLFGFVATLAAWMFVEQSSEWLYEGGLALYATGTVAILAAAVHPGPVQRVLSWRPLRALGLVSYGVYLFHWPVFLWLTPGRTGLSAIPLLLVRSSVTLALALVSYRFVESPIRHGVVPGRRLLAALPAAVAVVVIAVVVATVPPSGPVRLAAGVGATAAGSPEDVVASSPEASLRDATSAEPLRVLMVGDSVGFDAAPGIAAALQGSGEAKVLQRPALGFGLSNPPFDWRAEWTRLIKGFRPEVVVVMFGGWDNEYMQRYGEVAYTALVDSAIELLKQDGAKIVIVGIPASEDRDGKALPRLPNTVFEKLPARWPGEVDYIDPDPAVSPEGEFVPYLEGPTGEEERVRKVDGVHLCPAGAARVGESVLGALTPQYRLAAPDPTWRGGDWALDARYNDPRGSCPT